VAGVVDHDVEPAERGHGLIDRTEHRRPVADVQRQHDKAAIALCHKVIEYFRLARGGHHALALPERRLDEQPPEAAAGTRDEPYPADAGRRTQVVGRFLRSHFELPTCRRDTTSRLSSGQGHAPGRGRPL
jgi:hypothetical protein